MESSQNENEENQTGRRVDSKKVSVNVACTDKSSSLVASASTRA